MNENFPDIKNYEIIRRIGKGGFGEVYLAKASNSTFVAVKVIPSENAKRESEALKKYTSLVIPQSLIKILDSGEIEKAIYYIMPLADTLESDFNFPPTDFRWQEKSLAKLIDKKLNSPKNEWFSRNEILSCILPIFDAAIFLGENAMLHRDIKPDNILFFENQATLSDFGLLERDRRSLSNAGTPLYFAPSWYINKGGNPDAYGLATTFYTLITGNLPDAIGRPSYRFPDKIADTISDIDKEQWLHWHRCIMRAIAENPTERFLTLQDFRNAIVSEDFSSSINFEQSKDISKGNNAKLYATLTALAVLSVSALWYRSTDVPDLQLLQIHESQFDPKLFKQIHDNGFIEAQLGVSIESYAQWLDKKTKFYKQIEADYNAALKLSKKTQEEVVADVMKKYEADFYRHFARQIKSGEIKKEEIESSLNAYIKANKRWIDYKIKIELNRVSFAKKDADSKLATMIIIKSQIDDPKIYRQTAIEEYKAYQKKKDFLKNNK